MISSNLSYIEVNNTERHEKEIFIHPIPVYIRTTIVLSISLLIISGNMLGISVLFLTRQIPYIPRICLVNMGIADFSAGSVSCLPATLASILNEWPFGELWCQVSGVVHSVSLTNSMYSIVLISLDRYFAIVHSIR